MNKIERAFGSMEAAEAFEFAALHQPLLRLQTTSEQLELATFNQTGMREFKAVSGVVVGLLEEPPADNIPEPIIEVEQFCSARHSEAAFKLPVGTETGNIAIHSVRIFNPIFKYADVDTGVAGLLADRPTTAITVVTHRLILATLGELEAAQTNRDRTTARNATVLYALARNTLNAMWDSPYAPVAGSLKSAAP